MGKRRVLYVSQEIIPYTGETTMGEVASLLPQKTQESGKDIRLFLPRFGTINERRHQLHEVIRLSGMNMIIDDNDHPLIIKVASISAARMQVYFIDNDEERERIAINGYEKLVRKHQYKHRAKKILESLSITG